MTPGPVRTATGAWSAATAVAGLIWAAGGPGFPFGADDRATRMGAVLTGLDPRPAGVAIAPLGILGAVVAGRLAHRPWSRSVGWPAAAVLLLVVPDGRLLLAVGELLMLRVDRVEAAAVAQAWFATGGVLWAAVAYRPVSRRAPTWHRRVTYLAAAVPLVYAVPRALWAAGHPFGLDAATTAMVSSPGGRTRELVFACAATGGGLLTLGLYQRWGTRMLGLRVPRLLAVVPATAVAVVLTGAGVTMWRALHRFDPENWAAWVGNLAWLPWGVTLGLATWAYHRRSRVGVEVACVEDDVVMTFVRLQAVRWCDDGFPGWVEVELHESDGTVATIVDKAPVFDSADVLVPGVALPVEVRVPCDVLGRDGDDAVIRLPYGLADRHGRTTFRVDAGLVSVAGEDPDLMSQPLRDPDRNTDDRAAVEHMIGHPLPDAGTRARSARRRASR